MGASSRWLLREGAAATSGEPAPRRAARSVRGKPKAKAPGGTPKCAYISIFTNIARRFSQAAERKLFSGPGSQSKILVFGLDPVACNLH